MSTELTQKIFVCSYWNYFIELEEELISTKRFVDFDKHNNKTFSIEYLKLLQATCSEIDVVSKIMAEYFDPNFKSVKNKNIQKWGFVIQNIFPNIDKFTVRFNNDYLVTPWKNWKYERYQDKSSHTQYRLVDGCKVPSWWTAYNKVKHERTTAYAGEINYVRANLENLVSALAALFILENLFLGELENEQNVILKENSKLFSIFLNENLYGGDALDEIL